MAFGIGWLLSCLAVFIVIAVGWVINISDLIEMTNVLNSGLGIARIAGIFIPPLGAFLGYFW